MKLNYTSRKRLASIASFLFTLIFVAGTAFQSYAQQPMERVYADAVQKSEDDYLLIVVKSGYVENEGNAVDGNTSTAATLNSTGVTVAGINLGGEAVIRLRFTGPDKPAPGTPVTVKMGLGGAVLSLLNNITVQPVNGPQTADDGSGNEVGTVRAISDIVGVLAGENQIEFTITPTVAFDGLKIRMAPADGLLAASVLATAEVYDAYFLQPASGPLACNQPIDLLYGATGSIGSILNPVENPDYAIDGDLSTYAELNAIVSAVDNRTHITAIFPGSNVAGDSIRIVVRDPGGLLDLALLSEKFYVKTFNGTTDNGYLELDENLLRLRLLAGTGSVYDITYPVDQPFDRVQVAVGGGLAAALERLAVYEIGRLAAGPEVAGVVDDVLLTCVGGTTTLSINNPVAGETYQWYDDGGTAVGAGETFNTGALAAGDHIFYVTSTRPGCTTESGRTMVVVRVNPTSVAADITLDDVSSCVGAAAVLSPSSTVTNPVYTWYLDANKTEPISDGLTDGPVTYAIDASGVLTVTGLAAGASETYYVAVAGDGQCENAAGALKAVNVTVTEVPDAPIVPPSVSANTGDDVFLTAALPDTAPTGASIVWYDSSNTQIGTGPSIQVGPFATAGSYTFHAAVSVNGCESALANVVVEVVGAPVLPDETCNLPTTQTNGVDGLLCVLCQVSNPNNSIDDNATNFTRLTMGAGLAASVYQQLIFDQADKASNDSIRVRVAYPGGLADLGVLFQSTELVVRNGATEVSRYDLEDGLISLRLLGGNTYEVTIPAGGAYDRLEVRLNGGLLSAVTSLDIYGAQIIYPGPQDIPAEGITVCAGETPTLTVTGEANTTLTWFASATGGTALGTGNSFTPAAPLTTSTTYYIEVSRDGVNCVNPERVPFTVTVAPGATAADIVAGNATICESGTAVLTASLASGVTLTNPVYRWYSDAALTDLVHEEAASESSFTTPALTATTTYYVTVQGAERCENAPADAKVVTVTVGEAPAVPEVQANVTINAGQSTTLNASLGSPAPAGVELVWYDAATGGTELGTGETYTTGPLTANTIFYVAARNTATGCESLTRASVTVVVEGTVPGECLVANAQTNRTYAICVLCSVDNAGAAVDGDPNTASRFIVPAAVTGGVSQDLIFAESGQAGDTVVVLMGLSGSLLDVDLLGGVTFESFNGNTGNGDGDQLGGGLLELKLLPGNTRAEVKFIAGGSFDRVRVTYRPTLGVLNSSLELFEARIQLPDPTALPPANQTVCQGGTLTLTATAAANTTLQWYDVPTGGTPLATGESFDFVTDGSTAAGTHTFYIAVTRSGCENPERIPVPVTVTEAFTADAIVAPDVTICPGTATVTLSAELAPGVTVTDPVFTWYSDASLTTPLGTGANFVVDPAPVAATTTYYVTVSEAGGACENLAGNAQDVVVTVTNAPAAPTLVAANITACEGSVVTFEINNPQGGVVYNWYDAPTGGTLIHTGTSLTIDPAATDLTYYVETAVQGGGCLSDTRTAATLTVTPTGTAGDLTGPNAESLCEGEAITLTVTTTVSNPVIRWYSNAALSTLVHEEAAATSTFTTPVLSATTTYYVTVEGDGLCENPVGDAKEITVTVSEAPPAPEVQANVNISSGQSATLTASLPAGTDPDVEIVWYSAATGGTEFGTGATFNTGPLSTTTTFYVGTRQPVSGCESLTRVPVTVTVDNIVPGECLVANAQTNRTYAICVLCSVDNAGAAVDGDPNTASRFIVPAAVTGGVSQDLIFAESGQAGDTVVVLMGLSGSLLDVDLLGGVTFESFNGNTGNGDGDQLGGGLLELKLLPGNTRGEVKFIAGGAFDRVRVTYRPTLGVLNSSLELFEARIQLPDPTALPPANQTVCQGGTLTLTATAAANTTLEWYDAPTGGNLLASGDTYNFVTDGSTAAGTHTFYIAVTRSGCANPERIPVTVTVTDAYDADDIVAPGVTICEGTTTATLTAEAAPGLGIVNPVFTWYSDAALTTEIGTGASLTIDPAPAATTTYYVTIAENDGSCENLAGSAKEVVLTVTDAPASPTLVAANITTCEGSAVTFEIDNAQGGVTYNWYDAATGGTVVHTGTSLTVDPASADMSWYIETVVTGGGCISLNRTEATLTVTPAATAADITASDATICEGETAMLSATSTLTAPVFRWYSTADLSDAPHVGATYDVTGLAPGTHLFYVTVEGTGVCENLPAEAKVVTVTVGEAPALPEVQADVAISSGQSVTLVASLGDPAATDVELVWYDAATGGTELGTGATYTTGPLTATTTYYVAARNTTTGCESLARAEVTVTVDGVNPPQDCITANVQRVGAEGLCLICSVSNPGNAVDADPDNYSQLNASVGIAAGIWQELIFPEPGAAGDEITIELGLNAALADISLLSGLSVESYNDNTANGDGGAVDTDVIEVILLPGAGNRFTVTFTAEAAFDRVRVRFAALVAALENVRIYGAQMHFAEPTALPPANLTVCRGESVTLEATPAAGTTIRWYDAESGGNLLSSDNSYTTGPLMTVGPVTYYIAVVRNGCEDPQRIPVVVTVTPAPTAADISVTGNENPICADQPVILTPSSTTINDPVFTWYKDAAKTQPIASGTEGGITYAIDANGVLTVTGLTADVTYWVSVTADGGNGCENPAGELKSVPVSIQPNTPDGSITDVTVDGDNGNGEVCMPANGEIVLTATSSLAGAVFHWYDANGNPVPGGENGVLTLTTLTPGTHTYYVGVSNQDYCETIESERESITFTILPTVPGTDLAEIELTGILPGDEVCLDENGQVTLTAALTANSTVQNPVFHWYDANGDPVAGGESGVQKLTLAPGTYTYSVGASGDGFCETIAADRKSITFQVNETAGPDDLADLTLNGNVPAGGICLAPGQEVILTAALTATSTISNPVFHFYDEGGAPVTGGANGELNLGELAPGTYTFYAGVSGDGVCENLEANRKSITFTISNATTAADITASNATICEGESATLTAESNTVTNPVFRWYTDENLGNLAFTGAKFTTPALTANTTYYVTVSGDGACEGEAKVVTVDVGRGATAADITASDAATCGEEVTLSASSTVENAVFNWYSDAALTQLVHTGAEYTLTPTDDVTYYVTVQGTGVCENAPGEAKEVHVTVGDVPQPPTITSTDLVVCPGAGVTLTAESQAGTEIVWYATATGGDALFTGPELVIDQVDANTTYYAEARTAGGSCVSATRSAVEVEVIPQLAAPVVSCQDRTPSTVTFAWTDVAGATGYQVNVNDAGWEDPSSGTTGTTHVITNANPSLEYTIRVRAISGVNPCGNSESQATACEVEDFNDLYIPNAFTPNGDGRNDFFEVLGTYQSLDLKIYNQWGNKVFETKTKGQKWDGTYKGEVLPTGVYVYFVTVTMNDGREVFKKGSISLIR